MNSKRFVVKEKQGTGMSLRVVFVTVVALVSVSTEDQPRPLYVFGHMSNTFEDVDDYMNEDANAIEADFTFAPNGTALKMYHGSSGCLCGLDCEKSTDVPSYLTYLRDSVSEGGKYADQLLLFYADTKTGDVDDDSVYEAGVSLANNLIQHLWLNVPYESVLNVIIAISDLKDKDLLKGALDTFSQAENSSVFLDHVGFDIGGYNPLDSIADTYEELGIDRHRWQSNGIVNCLIFLYPTLRTKSVIAGRTADNSSKNYVDKAYVWTIDDKYSTRRFLRERVDAIVSNKPATILGVIDDEFAESYRLATSTDDPWQRIP